jgi:hypothetical protein
MSGTYADVGYTNVEAGNFAIARIFVLEPLRDRFEADEIR